MSTRTETSLIALDQSLTAALFGAQFVWAAAVVPTYRRLTPAEYLKVHTELTWNADAFMPALGLSTLMSSYLRYRRSGRRASLLGAVAVTAAGVAAARNLAINARLREVRRDCAQAAPTAAVEQEIRRAGARWARLHLLRTAGGLGALAAAVGDGGRSGVIPLPRGAARFGWLDAAATVVVMLGGRDALSHLAFMLRTRRAEQGPYRAGRAFARAAQTCP